MELLANFCWIFLTNAYNFADMPSFMVPQWWSSSTSLLRVDMDQLSVLLAIESDMVTHWCVRKDRSFSNTLFSVLLSIGFSFSTILIRYSKVNLVPLQIKNYHTYTLYFWKIWVWSSVCKIVCILMKYIQ